MAISDYKVGDRVRIIPLSDKMPNWAIGAMDRYCDTVMTIESISLSGASYPFKMKEDFGQWNWGPPHFAGLEDESDFDLSASSLLELL